MSKFTIRNIFLFVILVAPLLAQYSKSSILAGAGAPAGSCAPTQGYVNSSNGDWYTCNAGVWVKTGTGSGAGTVTSVTFTGDGTVLSSTPSTAVTSSGTVAATLVNAAAGSLLGNSTASTAAPAYGTYASFGLPQVVACTTHVDITNTGSITNNVVLACGSLANLIGANGRIVLQLSLEACTAASTPFASCAGINTGTCTLRVGLNTTNSGTSSNFTSGGVAAAKGVYMDMSVSNRNATNSQVYSGFYTIQSGASNQINQGNAAPGAFDTTGATFINLMLQNSVSGDVCGLRNVVATLWPK